MLAVQVLAVQYCCAYAAVLIITIVIPNIVACPADKQQLKFSQACTKATWVVDEV